VLLAVANWQGLCVKSHERKEQTSHTPNTCITFSRLHAESAKKNESPRIALLDVNQINKIKVEQFYANIEHNIVDNMHRGHN